MPTINTRTRTLQKAGCIHVTGLRIYDGLMPRDVIQAHKEELGKYNIREGIMALITEDGEVWLCDSSSFDEIKIVIKQYAPNGLGTFAPPCSYGEQMSIHQWLKRIADPFSNCNGTADPVPKIKD